MQKHRHSTLAITYSAAQYAVPAWCRSKHTRQLDVALNDTMRIITGRLQPTRTECLPVLAGIPPPSVRKVELTSKFVNKVVASEHHPFALPHSLCTPAFPLPQEVLYPDKGSFPDDLSPVMQSYYMVHHSSTSWNPG